MASLIFDEAALQSLIRQLENNGLFDEDFQREMLFAAADIMKAEAAASMKKYRIVDTGETARHVGYKKSVKTAKTGARRVTVSVQGKNRRGERYAAIAFVNNYGRHKRYGYIPATYFWSRAREMAEPKINAKWETMVSEKLRQKGLI